MSNLLAPGYVLRRPTLDDAPAVHALLTSVERALPGEPAGATIQDLLEIWRRIDLSHDAWVVIEADGDLAGYGYARRRQFVRNNVEVYVHPAHCGQGIGSTLLRLAEAWAQESVSLVPPGTEVFVTNWINARNPAARALLEREGYRPVRFFRRMGVALDTALPAPSWPGEITMRTAAEIGDVQPFYQVVEEGMADHWDHVSLPFEQWVARRCGPDFDPQLWFLAVDGAATAGAVLCRSTATTGWVDTLVVERQYRQQGLGSALLALALRSLAQHGHRRARLIVDAENLTGATRLYERAGMQIEQEYAAYRKLLGKEV